MIVVVVGSVAELVVDLEVVAEPDTGPDMRAVVGGLCSPTCQTSSRARRANSAALSRSAAA